MPQHASREDYQALSRRYVEHVSALEREITHLKSQNRDMRAQLDSGREAFEVGRNVMSRFRSRAELDNAIGSGNPADLQPGQFPDVNDWRASQLGGMAGAPVTGFKVAKRKSPLPEPKAPEIFEYEPNNEFVIRTPIDNS